MVNSSLCWKWNFFGYWCRFSDAGERQCDGSFFLRRDFPVGSNRGWNGLNLLVAAGFPRRAKVVRSLWEKEIFDFLHR
jgi:hypothetical protein